VRQGTHGHQRSRRRKTLIEEAFGSHQDGLLAIRDKWQDAIKEPSERGGPNDSEASRFGLMTLNLGPSTCAPTNPPGLPNASNS